MNIALILGIIQAAVAGFETVAPIVIHDPKSKQTAGVIITTVEAVEATLASLFGKPAAPAVPAANPPKAQ